MPMSANSTKRIDLDCGIPYRRISAWLDDELALERCGESWVFHDNNEQCAISLRELEKRSFRHLEFERTQLVAEGDAQALETFNHLFTLRFISAGG